MAVHADAVLAPWSIGKVLESERVRRCFVRYGVIMAIFAGIGDTEVCSRVAGWKCCGSAMAGHCPCDSVDFGRHSIVPESSAEIINIRCCNQVAVLTFCFPPLGGAVAAMAGDRGATAGCCRCTDSGGVVHSGSRIGEKIEHPVGMIDRSGNCRARSCGVIVTGIAAVTEHNDMN